MCIRDRNELLNLIPAETSKIHEAIEKAGISQCNAVICYNCSCGISPQKAKKAVSMNYLGSYKFEQNIEGVAGSLAGLEYMIWIGRTEKSREEFMEYFNQDIYMKELEAYNSCQAKKRPDVYKRQKVTCATCVTFTSFIQNVTHCVLN